MYEQSACLQHAGLTSSNAATVASLGLRMCSLSLAGANRSFTMHRFPDLSICAADCLHPPLSIQPDWPRHGVLLGTGDDDAEIHHKKSRT